MSLVAKAETAVTSSSLPSRTEDILAAVCSAVGIGDEPENHSGNYENGQTLNQRFGSSVLHTPAGQPNIISTVSPPQTGISSETNSGRIAIVRPTHPYFTVNSNRVERYPYSPQFQNRPVYRQVLPHETYYGVQKHHGSEIYRPPRPYMIPKGLHPEPVQVQAHQLHPAYRPEYPEYVYQHRRASLPSCVNPDYHGSQYRLPAAPEYHQIQQITSHANPCGVVPPQNYPRHEDRPRNVPFEASPAHHFESPGAVYISRKVDAVYHPRQPRGIEYTQKSNYRQQPFPYQYNSTYRGQVPYSPSTYSQLPSKQIPPAQHELYRFPYIPNQHVQPPQSNMYSELGKSNQSVQSPLPNMYSELSKSNQSVQSPLPNMYSELGKSNQSVQSPLSNMYSELGKPNQSVQSPLSNMYSELGKSKQNVQSPLSNMYSELNKSNQSMESRHMYSEVNKSNLVTNSQQRQQYSKAAETSKMEIVEPPIELGEIEKSVGSLVRSPAKDLEQNSKPNVIKRILNPAHSAFPSQPEASYSDVARNFPFQAQLTRLPQGKDRLVASGDARISDQGHNASSSFNAMSAISYGTSHSVTQVCPPKFSAAEYPHPTDDSTRASNPANNSLSNGKQSCSSNTILQNRFGPQENISLPTEYNNRMQKSVSNARDTIPQASCGLVNSCYVKQKQSVSRSLSQNDFALKSPKHDNSKPSLETRVESIYPAYHHLSSGSDYSGNFATQQPQTVSLPSSEHNYPLPTYTTPQPKIPWSTYSGSKSDQSYSYRSQSTYSMNSQKAMVPMNPGAQVSSNGHRGCENNITSLNRSKIQTMENERQKLIDCENSNKLFANHQTSYVSVIMKTNRTHDDSIVRTQNETFHNKQTSRNDLQDESYVKQKCAYSVANAPSYSNLNGTIRPLFIDSYEELSHVSASDESRIPRQDSRLSVNSLNPFTANGGDERCSVDTTPKEVPSPRSSHYAANCAATHNSRPEVLKEQESVYSKISSRNCSDANYIESSQDSVIPSSRPSVCQENQGNDIAQKQRIYPDAGYCRTNDRNCEDFAKIDGRIFIDAETDIEKSAFASNVSSDSRENSHDSASSTDYYQGPKNPALKRHVEDEIIISKVRTLSVDNNKSMAINYDCMQPQVSKKLHNKMNVRVIQEYPADELPSCSFACNDSSFNLPRRKRPLEDDELFASSARAETPPPARKAYLSSYHTSPPSRKASSLSYHITPPFRKAPSPAYHTSPPGRKAPSPAYHTSPPGRKASSPSYHTSPLWKRSSAVQNDLHEQVYNNSINLENVQDKLNKNFSKSTQTVSKIVNEKQIVLALSDGTEQELVQSSLRNENAPKVICSDKNNNTRNQCSDSSNTSTHPSFSDRSLANVASSNLISSQSTTDAIRISDRCLPQVPVNISEINLIEKEYKCDFEDKRCNKTPLLSNAGYEHSKKQRCLSALVAEKYQESVRPLAANSSKEGIQVKPRHSSATGSIECLNKSNSSFNSSVQENNNIRDVPDDDTTAQVETIHHKRNDIPCHSVLTTTNCSGNELVRTLTKSPSGVSTELPLVNRLGEINRACKSAHRGSSPPGEGFLRQLQPVLNTLLSAPEAGSLRHLLHDPCLLLEKMVQTWGGTPSTEENYLAKMKQNFEIFLKLFVSPDKCSEWGWEGRSVDDILKLLNSDQVDDDICDTGFLKNTSLKEDFNDCSGKLRNSMSTTKKLLPSSNENIKCNEENCSTNAVEIIPGPVKYCCRPESADVSSTVLNSNVRNEILSSGLLESRLAPSCVTAKIYPEIADSTIRTPSSSSCSPSSSDQVVCTSFKCNCNNCAIEANDPKDCIRTIKNGEIGCDSKNCLPISSSDGKASNITHSPVITPNSFYTETSTPRVLSPCAIVKSYATSTTDLSISHTEDVICSRPSSQDSFEESKKVMCRNEFPTVDSSPTEYDVNWNLPECT